MGKMRSHGPGPGKRPAPAQPGAAAPAAVLGAARDTFADTAFWKELEAYNHLDARERAGRLAELGLPVDDEEVVRIVSKSHFVIPGVTRFECQQCGECCRYAKKTATFTYEPCPFLTEDNKCAKHDNRYQVCKWFPFWVYNAGKRGPLLTIKPYCTGYGQGPLVDYVTTLKRMLELMQSASAEDDGAFVIHELVYLPEKKEWAFPSRQNVDRLLKVMSQAAVDSAAKQREVRGVERAGQLHYAYHYTSGLLGTLQDPQCTVNQEGQITDVNDEFCAVVGRGRTELVAQAFKDLFGNPEALSADLRRAFSKGRITSEPRRLAASPAGQAHVLLNAAVFRDRADGLVHEVLVCINPVAGAVFQELSQSRGYARGLLEASLDALCVIDPAGVITDMNEALTALSGRTAEDLLRLALKDLFSDPLQAEAARFKAMDSGKVRGVKLDLKTAGGLLIPVSYNATAQRGSDGSIMGVFVVVRDLR